jgi:hypothetical protein
MRLVVIISAVALGLVAGAVASAQADSWPADLWERSRPRVFLAESLGRGGFRHPRTNDGDERPSKGGQL